jgi:hypothetical protein
MHVQRVHSLRLHCRRVSSGVYDMILISGGGGGAGAGGGDGL